MSTNNPISFRFPFASQVASLPPEVQQVHKTTWNAITDLQGAIPALKSQIDALKKTTATTTAAVAAASNVTENTTTINETILGFSVSNQTGVTAYTVQQSDNTAMLLLSDASPIAVTLDTTLTIPYGLIPVNQGVGLVTLTPSTGTLNGAATLTIPEGYFCVLALDGTDWWAAVLPIVPLTFTPVAHEFLTGYDNTSGDFSAAQPSFADISGNLATSQLPTVGISVTITTAALTSLGAQGSQTFTNGLLTAQVQAT